MRINKVLVAVEDDIENNFLSGLFHSDGFTVIKTSSLQEGQDYINNYKFDMVIANGKSENSNFQLLRVVKEISPDTVVIILGDTGTAKEKLEAVKFGADAFLEKPFKIDEVRFALNKAIEKLNRVKELRSLTDRGGEKSKILQQSRQRMNRPKIGSSIATEPIRSLTDIERIKARLADKPRDFAMFVLGINTNLRPYELIKITVGKVRGLQVGYALLTLKEQKTGKQGRITINQAVYDAINNLLDTMPDAQDSDYLFQSRKGQGSLTVPSLNRMVKSWCREAGLKGNYGGETLRKTLGYIQFTHFKTDILTLMRMFNHPSPQRMLSYFNITDKEFTSLIRKNPSTKQALSYIGSPNSSSLAKQTTGLTEEKTAITKTNFRERMRYIYFEYQQSILWRNVVTAVRERDKKICQDCGGQPKKGIAHHTSYENWGKGNNEEIRDCVYLCLKCHNARHRKNGDVLTPFWASRNYDPDLDRIEEEDLAKVFMQEI